MTKYTVSVARTGYSGTDVEVDANSKEEAKDIALNNAGSYSFSEHESEYRVDHVMETKGKTVVVNGVEMVDCVALHHDD